MSVTTMRRPLLPEWLRPPEQSEDGTMALVDHLREFRYRVIMAASAIMIGMLLSLIFVGRLLAWIKWPVDEAKRQFLINHPDSESKFTTNGVTGSFMLTMKVGLFGGLLLSSPFWLYQLWAFIAPGLLAKEKKYAVGFIGAGVPLFLAGIALGYWISPKGFAVMMGFIPAGTTNLIDLNDFIAFEFRMLLVFGLSFLLPVILVALNLLGVVRGDQLSRFRMPAIFITFVFGAIATPSTDPFSMCALAVPMALMYIISETICIANDKRKAAHNPEFAEMLRNAQEERELQRRERELAKREQG